MDRNFLLCALAAALVAISCEKPATPSTVSGTIETDEVRVASRYGGRVEKLFARDGDTLTNSQLIAQLEADELLASRAEAAALLKELEEGPRKQEIAAAKSEWEAQLADLNLARTEEKRVRQLFDRNTVSEDERDRAIARAAALEKNVAAARSRYDLLLAGTRPERIAQARAKVEQLDAQLRELRIFAPTNTNSVLETLHVRVGDVLTPNREVATLLLPHLWVRVYVPEPWLGMIKLNQEVKVRVDSFPNRDFIGRVEQISRQAEFTPRNIQTVADRIRQVFPVKIDLTPHSADLRAGMAADAWFRDLPPTR